MRADALVKSGGAHAPRLLRAAPSPIALRKAKPKENFGKAPKSVREGDCAPPTNAISAPDLSQL